MFKLKLDPSKLAAFAKRYQFQNDAAALTAGKQIASGDQTRKNLEVIFGWKTRGRGKSRLQKNTDAEIIDALKLAVDAQTDRSAVAVLLGLNGVAIPVASAILTAISPMRFSIIDFRALWSLSVGRPPIYTIDYYLSYLAYCRFAAKNANLSLRDFDRALWQYSKENQPQGRR